jgi:hypothetical protein
LQFGVEEPLFEMIVLALAFAQILPGQLFHVLEISQVKKLQTGNASQR